MPKIYPLINKYRVGILVLLFSLVFSSWLMFSTFGYKDGDIIIASKAWSDFGSHIPLIRNFSLGNNFPPEYPLFSGAPIKYHFLFYLLTGLLEKSGMRIDYALNIPSILGFTALLLAIYLFAKKIFNSAAIGVISIILFLFNGSLSFIQYFLKNGLTIDSVFNIYKNTNFPSFGPYDGSIISAFWNLNIYTNQRHLAISYALSLFIMYLFLNFKDEEKRIKIIKAFFIGVFLGLSFLLNMAVFLMTIIMLFCFTLFLKKARLYIIISLAIGGIIALPQYFYISQIPSTFSITTHLGYLVDSLSLVNFLNYWLQNLGLHVLLIALGLFLTSKFQRKIFLSFFALFVIGNLIQFSPEIAANHKFFNFFIIVGGMFTAYALIELWNRKKYLKPVVITFIFFATFSGIIDFFPILNDSKIALADKSDSDVQWIIKNTPKDSVFLNTNYFMDKASIAGRKIFLGWPYFAWSQGYDTLKRDNLRKNLLSTNSISHFCSKSLDNNLQYVELNKIQNENYIINYEFFERKFLKLYENKSENYMIFDINKTCKIRR